MLEITTRFGLKRPIRLALLALPLLFGLTPVRGLAQEDPGSTQLFLNDRFLVEVDWMSPWGPSQKGQAVPITSDTGSFWFSDNANVEVVVRVLDKRSVNGHFWVLYGSLSDFEYRITVTDIKTKAQEIYVNPAGRLAGGTDMTAFDPEPPPIPAAISSALPDPAPARLGPEFRVNVTTQGYQGAPAVAVAPDGRSMIAWLGDPGGLQIRFYDSAGRPLSGEVFPASSSSVQSVQVAADAAGRYMVVWFEQGSVRGRIYGPDGQPATNAFAIGSGSQLAPDVVADPAGGFLVAWPESADQTLRLQRFGSLGNLVGKEVILNQQGQDFRLAAYPAGGGFVLTWAQFVGVEDYDIWAMRLDSSLRPVGTVLWANDDSRRHSGFNLAPAPIVHPDGGFSIVWTTLEGAFVRAAPGIFARRYDANGQPAGSVLQVVSADLGGEWTGTVLALPAGKEMVFWYDLRDEDFDSGGVFARLYDASWNPLGNPFRVNTYTHNLQVLPAAATNAAGAVVTAWTSTVLNLSDPPPVFLVGQDGDLAGVYAQRLTLESCAKGADQLCLGGRFRVRVRYTDPTSGATRFAHAATLTADSGAFWFTQANDTDLAIKVLDGRGVNGSFWVFYGALSDAGYTITVTDTVTGKFRRYHNPAHHQGSGKDLGAFPSR